MGKNVEKIIILVGASVAEAILLNAFLRLIPESLGKHILEASLLMAGIIGVAYLAIRLLGLLSKD